MTVHAAVPGNGHWSPATHQNPCPFQMLPARFSCDCSVTWILLVKINWANVNTWNSKCCKPGGAYGSIHSPPLPNLPAGSAVESGRRGSSAMAERNRITLHRSAELTSVYSLTGFKIYSVERYLHSITLLSNTSRFGFSLLAQSSPEDSQTHSHGSRAWSVLTSG